MPVPEVMNACEACSYLGLSTDTLYKYLKEGQIPAFKIGSRWRFKKSVLDRWMEAESRLEGSGDGRRIRVEGRTDVANEGVPRSCRR